MRLKEKNLLKKFAATLKKFSAQGAKKVEYGIDFHKFPPESAEKVSVYLLKAN